MWSSRLYECLMCRVIPILNMDSFRTCEETQLKYKFYLDTDTNIIYREDWVEYNYNLFCLYHTLSS